MQCFLTVRSWLDNPLTLFSIYSSYNQVHEILLAGFELPIFIQAV